MSTLSALVLKADGSALDLKDNANLGFKNSLIAADPLGIVAESKLLEKQTEAITDPSKYVKDRNAKIKAKQSEIYAQWMENFQKKIAAGYTEAQARLEADTIATGSWKGVMAAIDMEYPLTALGIALDRQVHRNQRGFEENLDILQNEKKTVPKKSGKARRGRGRGKK